MFIAKPFTTNLAQAKTRTFLKAIYEVKIFCRIARISFFVDSATYFLVGSIFDDVIANQFDLYRSMCCANG